MLYQIAAGHWTQPAPSHLHCFRTHKRNNLKQFGPEGSRQFIRAWLVVLLQRPLAVTSLVVWDTGVQKTPYYSCLG